jgi:hypothetical protein
VRADLIAQLGRHRSTAALGLLLLATIPMLTKVFTSDFGTHIAIGREIVGTLSIPDREFLNYPSLGMHIPNGQWGFQALLYLVHAAGGILAVSFLCWAVVLGIYLLMHRAMTLRGADPLLAVFAIFAFSGFLRIRIQPRPEIFTYLFIALTIFLFSEYYFGKMKRLVYLFPPMILAWANMHPTYLMAFILCGAFFVDALARAAWNRELRWERLKEWIVPPVAAGLLGLALCGLNPQGYDAFLTPLHLISRGARGGDGDSILLAISELTPVKDTGFYAYYKAAAWFAAASLALGAVGRRVYLLDLFLFAIAFKGAWDSARAVSMMGLFLSPGVSLHLTGFFGRIAERFAPKAAPKRPEAAGEARRKKGKRERAAPAAAPEPRRGFAWARAALPAAILAAIVSFGGVILSFSFRQLQYGVGMTEHKFSFGAAEFLRRNPVGGNMFNFFDIGGFLDWQLYPQALTFIDGRTYNDRVFREHQAVTGAAPGWREILAKYEVTHIVTKAMDSSGLILPLVPALANDPDWALVYADGLFLIFVRHGPERSAYVREHGLPGVELPRHIIRESHHYMRLGVSPVIAYQNISNMHQILGDREAAIRALRDALRHGDFPFLRARLAQLEQER